VQPGVVERERGRACERERGLERAAGDRALGIEREQRQRAEDLFVRRKRDHGRGRALLQERDERFVRRPERRRGGGVEDDGLPAAKDAGAQRGQRLRQRQDLPDRLAQPVLAHVNRHRLEGVAALVRHPQRGGVELEGVDDRPRDRLQGCLEREALAERPRDLVERAEAAGRLTLGLESGAALGAEPLCLLVQAGVLDGDRELGGQGMQKRLLVLAQPPAALGIDGQQSDQLLACAQRHAERALDAQLLERVADGRKPWVGSIGDVDQPSRPARAESQLEQALADPHVRAGEPALGRGLEPLALLDQVNGHAVGIEQLADAVDGRVERVGQRELGDRLADDRQEGARSLELLGQLAAPLARAQGVRRPHSEGGEIREHEWIGRLVEDELERAEGRLAELQRCDMPVSQLLERERLV
jgi:hypothetical protein